MAECVLARDANDAATREQPDQRGNVLYRSAGQPGPGHGLCSQARCSGLEARLPKDSLGENWPLSGRVPERRAHFEVTRLTSPRGLRTCLKIAFGVPPLGGTAREPPKGWTPNLRRRISVGFFRHALRDWERLRGFAPGNDT